MTHDETKLKEIVQKNTEKPVHAMMKEYAEWYLKEATKDSAWIPLSESNKIDPVRVGRLRQWLNEDCKATPMVTNNDIMFWLTGDKSYLQAPTDLRSYSRHK